LKGGWGVGSEISYFFFNFLSNSKGKGIFLGECLNHFESGCSFNRKKKYRNYWREFYMLSRCWAWHYALSADDLSIWRGEKKKSFSLFLQLSSFSYFRGGGGRRGAQLQGRKSMCGPKGYGFWSENKVSILEILVSNRIWFLLPSLELPQESSWARWG